MATEFTTPNSAGAGGDRGSLGYVNRSAVTATKIVRSWFVILVAALPLCRIFEIKF